MSSIKEDVVIGIDPGESGSICLLMPGQNNVAFKETTEDPLELLKWFELVKEQCNLRCIIIENVHSLPKMSAKSNFTFGRNVEKVNLIARMSKVRVELVQPKTWQKFAGVKQKGPAIKKEVAEIAYRLYPTARLFGPRGGLLDGRSDALMIAHYGAYNKT
jgi:hypothetical protein